MKIGANYLGNGECEFIVWSPNLKEIFLEVCNPSEVNSDKKNKNQVIAMHRVEDFYWKATVNNVSPGFKYAYIINNRKRPDPASNYQPDDVHGYSQIVDHNSFTWDDDDWKGISLYDAVLYELHIGTFTKDGTFEAAISKLDDLIDLGVTAIELMPVAQFPGKRNWGYDGVSAFAPNVYYGGPEGLKRLVQACHKKNIGVILDVVYNHFGPEGNYLNEFGPYFTNKYKTPWGMAVNFDDEYSDGVRNFFIQNALYWLSEYRIDGLRLDAVHQIYDMSAVHIIREITENVEKLAVKDGRKKVVIAESDLNNARIIKPVEQNGYGCDAQWCDDFHHSVHSLLTEESDGYYQDFGTVIHMIDALKNSFVYAGSYSKFRKRRFGDIATDLPPNQFVVSIQNHDQVGNRAFGERLSNLISFEKLKLAAAAMLLSPYIPLLFMGEEYAEEAPFLYFISHIDENLVKAVRDGRKKEFSSFLWKGEIPDPYDEQTFQKSKLNWNLFNSGKHNVLRNYYKALLNLRKTIPSLNYKNRDQMEVLGNDEEKIVSIKRWTEPESGDCILALLNFNSRQAEYTNLRQGSWIKIFDSSDNEWMGKGSVTPELITPEDQKILLREYNVVLFKQEINDHET